MGYSSLFFARLDYNERARRRLERSMEMMWNASDDYGNRYKFFIDVEAGGFTNNSGFHNF
jgi:alpha-mannosidase